MIDIRHAAKFAMHNRKEIETTKKCGCFHCLAIFLPEKITEWTDDEDTAICPHCGVDSVLAESDDMHFEPEILHKIRTFWY